MLPIDGILINEIDEIAKQKKEGKLTVTEVLDKHVEVVVGAYQRDKERERLLQQVPVKYIKTVVLYARVSTKDKGQDTENQLAQLRQHCKVQQWEIIGEYIDYVTGKNSDRDQFKLLFDDAYKRKFDLVLFWSLDRFSREGVLETLQHLQKLTSYKVDWKSYTEQYLDSCGIFRDVVLAVLATIAKQERIRIVERTIAGLEVARAKGVKFGRHKLVVRVDHIIAMKQAGISIRNIAKELGIKRGVVELRLKEAGYKETKVNEDKEIIFISDDETFPTEG